MSYRKQISYLELQDNGQRIRSAGYAKLESRETEEILTVQLNGQNFSQGRTISLYLQRESGEELLCEMTADRGRASCEKRIPGKKDRESILGIRIPLDRNLEIIGRFAGAGGMKKAPVAVTAVALEQASRPVQAEQQEIQNGEMQRELTPDAKQRGQDQAQNEPQTLKKAATENTLHMKDTKWEQLSNIYPHIHPFRDAREFLSVGPEDFVVLRERCYQMTHNSFLLHGYYNYRHLLLMRQDTPEQVKYYIGVPGNFYEREKQVARMFGFESFEGTREPAWEGDFGYYLISVEL